jgi:hypothetical protein
MADVQELVRGINRNYKDNGDGTWSPQVYSKTATDATTPGTTDRVTARFNTLIDVVPTVDTAIYAAGDTLFQTVSAGVAFRAQTLGAILRSVVVIDKSDQGTPVDFDLWLLSANVTLGVLNNPPSISDLNAQNLLGVVSIAQADYKDLGGCKVATKSGLALPLKPASGGLLYIGGVNGTGTPTFGTASDLYIRLGIEQD